MTHRIITLDEYFGTHKGHPSITDEIIKNAEGLLAKVNPFLVAVQETGFELPINPVTNSLISGRIDGGFRAPNTKTGATQSKHRYGQGVDIFDPMRKLARFIGQGYVTGTRKWLEEFDLYIENPAWTLTWFHLQSVPPGSKRRVYVPSQAPATCSAIPGLG